ncbi:hypothetical protein [Streptomyces sp. NPDC017988]|uniref:hypothetical protein n=1 Tax=Streptomyces sp. NPDC017988 TaxID=3365025 RepID=UPI0037BAFF99
MHRGAVVHEMYRDGTQRHTPHFNASAAKSYIGLTVATLVHQGLLDRSARASAHIPELAWNRLRRRHDRGPAAQTDRPGSEFRYENGNVETLAEILRRITGLTTSALLSDMVWSKTGAEEDAYYVLDGDGVEVACGGFSATARDVARLGELLRHGGAVGDRQRFRVCGWRAVAITRGGLRGP